MRMEYWHSHSFTERKVKGLISKLMGFQGSLWDSAAKNIDQHWPDNVIYGTKNWLFSFLTVNQEELGRSLQGNNREIDTKSATQMVPWLLTSWGGDFLTNLVVSHGSIPLKPLILKLIQGWHTVLRFLRQQLQKLVPPLNVKRRKFMNTVGINNQQNSGWFSW